MKTLILFFLLSLARTVSAAAFTIDTQPLAGTLVSLTPGGNGYEGATFDTFHVNLRERPGTVNDLLFTLQAPSPLVGFTALFNTAPAGVGSGVCIYLDGLQAFCSPAGTLLDQRVTIYSDVAFSTIRLETFDALNRGYQGEHLDVTAAAGQLATPEPSTLALGSLAALLLALRRRA